MRRRNVHFLTALGTALFLGAFASAEHLEVSEMAKKLLYGDKYTRMEAVKEFNKLPQEAQYKLVPDFMVAMSDEDPDVRKIASRILKAMGVRTEGSIPDAKNTLPTPLPAVGPESPAAEPHTPTDHKDLPELPATPTPGAGDKWADEKKMKADDQAKWSDLEKMKKEGPDYSSMKEQLEAEKHGAVSLDASQLMKDSPEASSPMGSVVASLKDPDPWVRAQAARRLAMVHPAPMDAIPDLVKMLGDKEPESRRAAAAALGSFGPLAKSAMLPLNSALSDPDPAVRQIAEEALKLIQQPQ